MLFATGLAALAATAATPVRLPDDLVRVGDVAIVARGRDLPILRLASGAQGVTLDQPTLRVLVANRLPGTRFMLRGSVSMRFVRGQGGAPAPGNCLVARTTVPAGVRIDAELVERARCTGAVTSAASVGYDRATRTPFARKEIAAGANLGPLRIGAAASVPTGQAMTLRTSVGPVTIERQVVSLQPARAGRRAFVRTDDGSVMSARMSAGGDQLFRGDRWAGIASDNRAQQIGDTVMVLISEAASATNRVRNTSSKDTKLSGGLSVGGINESGNLGLRGGYAGSGEVERTDRFVARMAAKVVETLPNGDFVVEGRQNLMINGERRDIVVRGQVRQIDISSDNAIASSRLANAQINYDGKGWVSRSAKPGVINQIFSFLGIG